VVEGPIPAGRQDVNHHAVEIIEHIARCNPQRLKPRVGKHAIAFDIPLRVVAHRVGLAIHLDRQSTLKAREVNDISVQGELTAEAQAIRPLAQLLPENDFGEGQLTSKLAGEADVCIGRANGTMPDASAFGPSTMLRMVPLPVPGRN
jgi:hypothetical protein